MMLFGVSVNADTAYDFELFQNFTKDQTAPGDLIDSIDFVQKHSNSSGMHGSLSIIATQYGGEYNLTDIFADNFTGYQAYKECDLSDA